MKSAPFDYRAPESLDEALSLLAAGDGARVLAGGQSLVPLMKCARVEADAARRRQPRPRARRHRGARRPLRVGALTRQQALLDGPDGAPAQPLLRAAGRFAGYLATRHRGTVGGSLAFAAPWAELTAGRRCARCRASRSARRAASAPCAARVVLPRARTRPRSSPTSCSPRSRIPAAAARDRRRLPRGQRALPRLRPGRGRRDRHARRGGTCTAAELVLLRVAPTPHPRRRLPPRRDRSSTPQRSRRVARVARPASSPPDDIEVERQPTAGASR